MTGRSTEGLMPVGAGEEGGAGQVGVAPKINVFASSGPLNLNGQIEIGLQAFADCIIGVLIEVRTNSRAELGHPGTVPRTPAIQSYTKCGDTIGPRGQGLQTLRPGLLSLPSRDDQ